ncbi:hypothetical protein D6821_00675 [Candidatus Parcubacteria bacterium]|nr:MAG: hypothetical protein D6821_00675 [Candidatus Parcubacteria bacterium]
MTEFSNTVNLRKKLEQDKKRVRPARSLASNAPTKAKAAIKTSPTAKVNKAKAIDKVLQEAAEPANQNLQTMARPQSSANYNWFKTILLIIILGAGLWGFYHFKPSTSPAANPSIQPRWYMVKLVNGEIFYGLIEDTKADPVVIKNVYYNYDQTRDKKEGEEQKTGLRLVKRGGEKYDPDGTLNIVRTQILYMEPLREDSRVLKAIRDYESR